MMVNTSFLEGLRIASAMIGLLIVAWSWLHAADGMTAFATPIRPRMLTRRKWQLLHYLAMLVLLLNEALIAAGAPSIGVKGSPTLTAGVTQLALGGLVISVSFMQARGWIGFERILGRRPLDPTVQDATAAGRPLWHQALNDLALITTTLELLEGEPLLSEDGRLNVDRASAAVDSATAQVLALRREIAALDPSYKSVP